jgi:hypothetical protein
VNKNYLSIIILFVLIGFNCTPSSQIEQACQALFDMDLPHQHTVKLVEQFSAPDRDEHNGTITPDGQEFYPSVSRDEELYFTSQRDDGLGGRDIYRVPLKSDAHELEHLEPPVNSELDEGDVCVVPDGSYLIIKINEGDQSYGKGDFYISRKTEDGDWTKPKNLGAVINTENHEYSPMITSDGRFLFFTRVTDGKGDIYCVSTDLINSD